MLEIVVEPTELWDAKKEEFVPVKGQKLALEHSLVSISKWESKWHKPFMTKEKKTKEELIDYIKCMTITPKVDPNIYLSLGSKELKQIEDYINDPMTATTINNRSHARNREIITSEIIYYWMVELRIPVEFERWHINRLITLIQVCNIKNGPKKKMPRNEIYNRNAKLNAARRAAMHTKG